MENARLQRKANLGPFSALKEIEAWKENHMVAGASVDH
jgi:hypothetical protein